MQTESIEITTSKEKFFREYLILKKPVIDSILSRINKKKTVLNDIPLKVLSQLLYYNNEYRDLAEKDKWEAVFSKSTKDKICETLEMKEHHLNIYISQLRSIGILEGKTIRKGFIVYAESERSLNFIFKIHGY